MSDTSLRFNFLTGRDTASPHMKRIAATSMAMGAAQKAASLLAISGYVLLGGAIAGLVGQTVALGAALGPLIGLLGLLPALAVGAAAGLAPLLFAFRNIGAALRTSSTGGANAAQSLASAERRVELALRSSTDAQERLNDARAEAARRLADVSRELARAQMDERSAVLGVAEAQRRLREARSSGDRLEREGANIGLQQSIAALDDVRLRIADLKAEEADRSAKGVEGSDEVQQALRQQADAMYELAAAQQALAQAGQGGGGVDKAAEAYAKLTAEGKALVDVLRGIPEAWRPTQQAIQSATFAGVAADVQNLSSVWLANLSGRLVELGQGWNAGFRGILQLSASQPFVDDLNVSLGNMADFGRRMSASFAPFLSGFMHWTVVGSTFLPGIGAWIQSIGERFERWSAGARESRKASEWIDKSLVVLGQLWEVLKNLGTTIRGIFAAGSGGPNWMADFVAGTQKMSDWVNSDVGQGKLAAVFTTLREVGDIAFRVLGNVAGALLGVLQPGGAVTDTISVFGTVVSFAADHLGLLAQWLPTIVALFVAWRVAQSAAVVVDIIRVPLIIAQTVAMFTLAAAMRAQTAATVGTTVATRGLSLAMIASPIGLIITLIVALVAGFIYLWNTNEGFRDFFIGMWSAIVDFFVNTVWHNGIEKVLHGVGDGFSWLGTQLKAKIDFMVNVLNILVAAATNIRTRIVQTLTGIWDGIVNGLKSALNSAIWLVNNAIGFINNSLIGNLNRIPGVSIPFLVQIPFLDTGGDILKTGLAVVHEGEHVSTAAEVRRGEAGGGGKQVVELRLTGADREFLRFLRKVIKDNGGPEMAFV